MTAFVRTFICSLRFEEEEDFVRVLLPHFSRRLLHIWLYSLWKSVMYVLLPHFSRRVLYGWLHSFLEIGKVISDNSDPQLANC